jgi:hypothetical protein
MKASPSQERRDHRRRHASSDGWRAAIIPGEFCPAQSCVAKFPPAVAGLIKDRPLSTARPRDANEALPPRQGVNLKTVPQPSSLPQPFTPFAAVVP